jgi:hypothetical protein
MRLPAFALCLLPLAGLTSCASIVNGSTENVTVQTNGLTGPLQAAQCDLSNHKGDWVVTTPQSVIVHRGSEPLQVKCTKSGYQEADEAVQAGTSGAVYGNIVLGGGLGATVDTVDGAAWKYPKTITVSMIPTPSSAPQPATP